MTGVRLSIVAPSGAVIPLVTTVDEVGSFRVLSGTTGLGLPTPTNSLTDSAGDGRRAGNVRVSGRTIVLSVEVHGTDREATEANLNALADAISVTPNKPLPRLRATYPDGSAREIEFLHNGGGLETHTDEGPTVVPWILTLDCPDAYWTAVDYSSFTVQQTATSTGFLESLPEVYLLPSDAFGVVTITNPGRVESWIDWELQGPFTRVDVSTDSGGWSFIDTVAEGTTIFIRKTAAGIEVVDQTGANRYSSISDVPIFFRLPAGASSLTVSLTGATTASKVIGRYKPRYRLVH
jgi:hypothetical protein